ncbi:hypothetical protein [Arthrobacter sp. SLBN-112]|uniref:hypothetical protein n=1 Tax=Arthrobacter sp. SLBN-112 TaxID=2768452 RepID=UPI0027B0E359|nr:hypothetical protein [Arthrobacter sp. SLBN-112]MDQ0799205.1 hypothetical protein [Arthrobacter sp. SLBN-112]
MKRTLATLGVMGLGLLSLTAPAMAASDQVVVCHWDGSTLTPMSFNTNGTGGHDQHADDIIPPTPKLPAGKNWDNAGKIRYVNECGAALPPGEVIDPPVVVDPPVVTPPVVTPPVVVDPPVVTPPTVVDPPVVTAPVVVDQPVVQPPAVAPVVDPPAAVVAAAAPAQPAPVQQVAAAPQAAPAAAPVSVGTNEGFNAQTAVDARDGGPAWLAGVGALAAAGAAVAVRRRSRSVNTAG